MKIEDVKTVKVTGWLSTENIDRAFAWAQTILAGAPGIRDAREYARRVSRNRGGRIALERRRSTCSK